MAIDLQTVIDLKNSFHDEYEEEHFKFRRLRQVYAGKYWEIANQDSQARSISSIFRDIGRSNRAQLPPIRIVNNTLHSVCVKYQTFLSPVPMVNYYVDPPETDEARHNMTLKERYTYGAWRSGGMSNVFRDIAWYQPLMGDVFIGCYPDTEKKIPVPVLRSPETAYPIRGLGGTGASAHIFHWKERDSVLMRTFPDYVALNQYGAPRQGGIGGRRGSSKEADPMVDVYEYSDENEFARFAGESKVAGIEHNFGFDIFQHAKFISVPGQVFGHGAIEQAVNLNEADNMIGSLMFQAMLENVFPTIVLTDPSKAPEEMMKGPGSVITLNPGGKYQSEAPPVEAIGVQLNYMASLKQSMQEQTGMPAVNFGTSPASSIVTGAAINELQGAGTGSTVEMVQGSLGTIMSKWNEMALYQQKTLWPDEKIVLNYMTPLTKKLPSVQGTLTITGKQLVGGTANEIVFSPAMDLHDKLVMMLQGKGAGIYSDQYIMKQLGIPDPESMQEEIFQEQLDRAVLGFIVQRLTNPDPDSEAQSVKQGVAFIEGNSVVVRAGPPPGMAQPPGGAAMGSVGPSAPPGAQGPPGVAGTAAMQPGGAGLIQSKPLQEPPGSPVPAGAAASASPLSPSPTTQAPATVNTVVRALSQGQYQGRVWLVGEIVVKGQTAGSVDVAVTDPGDRATVAATAPQFQFTFHVVKGVPAEANVEVTPQTGAPSGGPQEPQ